MSLLYSNDVVVFRLPLFGSFRFNLTCSSILESSSKSTWMIQLNSRWLKVSAEENENATSRFHDKLPEKVSIHGFVCQRSLLFREKIMRDQTSALLTRKQLNLNKFSCRSLQKSHIYIRTPWMTLWVKSIRCERNETFANNEAYRDGCQNEPSSCVWTKHIADLSDRQLRWRKMTNILTFPGEIALDARDSLRESRKRFQTVRGFDAPQSKQVAINHRTKL